MIGSISSLNDHWHKANGDLADGYRLYFFESQTTTPLAVYKDKSGTSFHEHPITIQPDGKVPGGQMFFEGSHTYRSELRDELDVSIETKDFLTVNGATETDGLVIEIIGSENIEVDSSDSAYPIISTKNLVTSATFQEHVDNIGDGAHSENNLTDELKAIYDNYANSINTNTSAIDNNETNIGINETNININSTAIDDIESITINGYTLNDDIEILPEDIGVYGVGELGDNGLILSSQLPSTIDEVIDAYIVGTSALESDWLSTSASGTPLTPSDSTIYLIVSTGEYENTQYRWSGTRYALISSSLALGETANTAYRGDYGNLAYEHSLATSGNPHNVTIADIGALADTTRTITTAEINKLINVPSNTNSELTLKANDANVVHTDGDEYINGTKTFNYTIEANGDIDMGGYTLPTLGIGEVGQVLTVPVSGSSLEWTDKYAGDDLNASTAFGYTAEKTRTNTSASWDEIYVISKNNDLLDTEISDENNNFDIDTGIFTAPIEGHYFLGCSSNIKGAFTGSENSPYEMDLTTYVKYNGKGYFINNTGLFGEYTNLTIGCESNGILKLNAGDTVEFIADVYYSRSDAAIIEPKLFKCSIHAHKICSEGLQGPQGIPGVDGTSGIGEAPIDGTPYSRQDAAWIAATGGGTSYWKRDTTGIVPILKPVTSGDENYSNATRFNTSGVDPVHEEGTLYFDIPSRSLQVDMETTDVHLSLGRELMERAYNDNGDATNGQCVSLGSGYEESTGETIFKYELAKANNKLTCSFIGLLTNDILSGEIGEVTTYGKVRNINTSGFNVDDIVYVSSDTLGGLTNIAPVFPNYECVVGKVLKSHATEGVIWVNPDLEPQIAESSSITPPTISLVNPGSVNNSYCLLYRSANTNNKPSYRDSQSSQFDNGDCDPIISLGGIVRAVSITCVGAAVEADTKAETIYSRLEMYSIKTSTQGGPTLLATFDVEMVENDDIGVYNNTGATPGLSGSIVTNVSVPSGTLLGFQLKHSAAFTGGDSYINAWRTVVVGISIY